MLKATENNAVYTSQILKQEENDGDWTSYDLTVTTDPKDLGVLDTSTQTQLETTGELVTGDEIIIHDGVSFKEGTIGTVTYDADLVPPQSINNTTYDSISASLKSSVLVTSNVTYDNISFDVPDANKTGLHFSPDGTKMFVTTGTTTSSVLEYSLSTPWDISTANYVMSYSAYINNCHRLSPDGTKSISSGWYSPAIYIRNLSTAWDLSTISTTNDSSFAIPANNANGPYQRFSGFDISPDGTKIVAVSAGGTQFRHLFLIEMSTPWDLSTATLVKSQNIYSLGGFGLVGCCYNSNGTKVYIISTVGVLQFSLSTPYIGPTAYYDGVYSYEGHIQSPECIAINPSDDKIYILDYYNTFQYSLEKPGLIVDTNVTNPETNFKTIKVV